jgi:hypothetical protein
MADGSIIRILETATGNILPYPTNNDTSQAQSLDAFGTQCAYQRNEAAYRRLYYYKKRTNTAVAPVGVGSQSSTLISTLTNTGTATNTITSIVVSGGVSNATAAAR